MTPEEIYKRETGNVARCWAHRQAPYTQGYIDWLEENTIKLTAEVWRREAAERAIGEDLKYTGWFNTRASLPFFTIWQSIVKEQEGR